MSTTYHTYPPSMGGITSHTSPACHESSNQTLSLPVRHGQSVCTYRAIFPPMSIWISCTSVGGTSLGPGLYPVITLLYWFAYFLQTEAIDAQLIPSRVKLKLNLYLVSLMSDPPCTKYNLKQNLPLCQVFVLRQPVPTQL